jgi:hypothetical protein
MEELAWIDQLGGGRRHDRSSEELAPGRGGLAYGRTLFFAISVGGGPLDNLCLLV